MKLAIKIGVALGLLTLVSLPFWRQTNYLAATDPTNVEVSIWMRGGPDIIPIKNLETLLGVKFDGAKWYVDWDDTTWRYWIPNGYHNNGYIPEMTWQPMYTLPDGSKKGVANTDILAGVYDSYLDTMSANIKALPYRLRISHAPEFNGWWNPWAPGKVGNTTENFKTSWRYIVDRFKENGVNNVDWIWSPNVDPYHVYPSFASMYPGDAYVTYFGLDGYNFGTNKGGTWQTFRQVYDTSYNDLLALSNKDIYIMEIGCAEEGGSKAAWIKQMFEDFPTRYPRIKGLTWFNVNDYGNDMRIESSVESRTQFALSVNGQADPTPPPLPTDPITDPKSPTLAPAPLPIDSPTSSVTNPIAQPATNSPTAKAAKAKQLAAASQQIPPATGFTLGARLDPSVPANSQLIVSLLLAGVAVLTALVYGVIRWALRQ